MQDQDSSNDGSSSLFGSSSSPSIYDESANDHLEGLDDDAESISLLGNGKGVKGKRGGVRRRRRGGGGGGGGFCGGLFGGSAELQPRLIQLAEEPKEGDFPANVTRNQKYTVWNFLPIVLFLQFRYFQNMYFLLVALSQFIPMFRIGFLFTYVAPLAFVVMISVLKEAYDDIQRYRRDKDLNGSMYQRLTPHGAIDIPAADIKVGHYIILKKDQRVPADMVLLRTTEKTGASFIRTDQLDGETDWKLRYAVPITQKLASDESLFKIHASVYADEPIKDIYKFIGRLTLHDKSGGELQAALDLENTLWANTVLATGSVIGLVVYTGKESRSAMNTSMPSSKMGLLDEELNHLSKVLFGLVLVLSSVLITLHGFTGHWFTVFIRYNLLFSSIIPISMRVNLEMGKTLYSYLIKRDKQIPGSLVRTSTICEELGRIEYLLSDKTGTLTQNVMAFKKIHVGTALFGRESRDEMKDLLLKAFSVSQSASTADELQAPSTSMSTAGSGVTMLKKKNATQLKFQESLLACALAHNVTPVTEDDPSSADYGKITYQAASPDEIALVEYTESVGLTLSSRSTQEMTLSTPTGEKETFDILQVFPFTSESKRMGIVVKSRSSGLITFYMKGADTVMGKIVSFSDWLDEEVGNMAREGLRTLVFGKKNLTEAEFAAFSERYHAAKTSITDRAEAVMAAQQSLEVNLELLCVTGVEDKLQENVRQTLETLANAGIKIWMLTGDKIETATNIAISARLIKKDHSIHSISKIQSKEHANLALNNYSKKTGACLIIDGGSLQLCLDHYSSWFIQLATKAPAVVACRCSPTQKAVIVSLIKNHTGKRTCAIGDGGNDVSMIQAANVGIGIVGKEGKQASLAADFSINQFSYIARLILWHGRNSYNRSARLSQFVMHRGLIISFIQAVFSSVFYFAAIAIYNGWLLVGYATYYTMFPVFSLVLDEDVSEHNVLTFPELYKELQKGRSLSNRTFFIWVAKSIFQAGVIMIGSLFLFYNSFRRIISITFTSLIFTELINVAFEIQQWHSLMIWAQVATVAVYFASFILLPTYFDIAFISSWDFIVKTALITFTATAPIYALKAIKRRIAPPSYEKIS